MRILLYNFVQPEEPGAGGVGVYLSNLAKALGREHEVILLSSGDRYSLRRREPRIEFSRDDYHRAVVVNSPVVAPAAYSFANPGIYLDSCELDFVAAALAERYGQIDVLHFQNIEGLTRSFFYEVRRVFPEARIIYSAHNYHPMCLRVSLWYQDRMVCEDYRDGVACTMCDAPIFDPAYIRGKRRLAWAEKKHPLVMGLLSPALALAKKTRRGLMNARRGPGANLALAAKPKTAPAADYAAFRQANIELSRSVFDHNLSVSARTRQVVTSLGVPEARTSVSYIGTAYKDAFLTSKKIQDYGASLHLGYIGYMGRDKGFHFLIEALERMPAAIAFRTTITVAARNIDPDALAHLRAVGERYRKLRYFDGYTHADLDEVLDGVNLGLIPVLWEDNLPQTAIELVSRGIPILTSDRGGAQEISGDPKFIFEAGRHDDFVERIRRISDREVRLAEFWRGEKRIFSMDEHVADLMNYYRPPVPTPTPVDPGDRPA